MAAVERIGALSGDADHALDPVLGAMLCGFRPLRPRLQAKGGFISDGVVRVLPRWTRQSWPARPSIIQVTDWEFVAEEPGTHPVMGLLDWLLLCECDMSCEPITVAATLRIGGGLAAELAGAKQSRFTALVVSRNFRGRTAEMGSLVIRDDYQRVTAIVPRGILHSLREGTVVDVTEFEFQRGREGGELTILRGSLRPVCLGLCVAQENWFCTDCRMGLCQFCAERCHSGHRVTREPGSLRTFSCRCGCTGVCEWSPARPLLSYGVINSMIGGQGWKGRTPVVQLVGPGRVWDGEREADLRVAVAAMDAFRRSGKTADSFEIIALDQAVGVAPDAIRAVGFSLIGVPNPGRLVR